MWNPSKHTDDENLSWCWLRAIEWDAWPFFISQPIVPLLLVEDQSWWEVLLGLMAIQAVWSAFTYSAKYVNVWLAGLGVWIAMLRWISCPVAAYELFARHEIGLALYSLFWPFLMHVLKAPLWIIMGLAFGFFSKYAQFGQVGFFQTLFMQKLGYTRREDREYDLDYGIVDDKIVDWEKFAHATWNEQLAGIIAEWGMHNPEIDIRIYPQNTIDHTAQPLFTARPDEYEETWARLQNEYGSGQFEVIVFVRGEIRRRFLQCLPPQISRD